MPSLTKLTAGIAMLASVATVTAAQTVPYLLWSRPWNGNTTSNASMLIVGGSSPWDTEVADDFDVVGQIHRVVVTGHGCFQCSPPTVLGVWVRFWSWTAAGPGGLQAEVYLEAGDPGFVYDPSLPDGLDITLPVPFEATGPHFVSVQMVFSQGGWWDWWTSSHGAPAGAPIYFRDAATGGGWGPHIDFFGQPANYDVAYELYGTDDHPPPDVVAECGRWRVYPAPDPDGADRMLLRDVAAVTQDDAWAVGEVSRTTAGNLDTFTLAFHWDGQRWQEVETPSPSPYPGGTWADLAAVDLEGDRVWAAGSARIVGPDGFVGSHLLVLYRGDDGWTIADTPTTSGCSGNFIRGIHVAGPNDVWFVGDWCGSIPDMPPTRQPALALHWDGASFDLAVTPAPYVTNGGYGLDAIDGVAADDLWAVGGGGDGDWTNYSYVIHWDGRAWHHVPFDMPGWLGRLWSVRALASDDVWMGGVYQDADGLHPLLVHWDGTSLTTTPSPAGGGAFLAFGADDVLTVGGGAAHWDGTAWSLEPEVQGVVGPSLLAATETGECSGWVVGRHLSAGDLRPLLVQLEPIQGGFGGPTPVFADGFESADTSAWSTTVP